MSKSIYHQEHDNLEQSKTFLARNEYSKMELQLEFKRLIENYEELVDQVKIITKISDRLQKKLNNTNEQLEVLNLELNDTNAELKETIDALTAARIGKKAATIVIIIAVILFMLSSVFIEPEIDKFVDNYWIAVGLKLVVALMLNPIQSVVEKSMLRQARKKQIREAANQQ